VLAYNIGTLMVTWQDFDDKDGIKSGDINEKFSIQTFSVCEIFNQALSTTPAGACISSSFSMHWASFL